MKEAHLYEKLEKNQVRCHVCSHHCTILPGQRGICGVRENHDGTLHLLVYAKAVSEAIDPIEKKPFFHFLPGSQALSIATVGCNFRCDNCQNWQISQASKQTGYTDLEISGEELPPEKVVQDALEANCQSIAYTYTEPTVWLEYAYDCMKLAHQHGIKNAWVSNGYMSEQTRQLISPYLDAINIDLKFFNNNKYRKITGGRLEPVLNNLKFFVKHNIWVEITTLVIPGLSDDETELWSIAKFIKKNLGKNIPWHLSAFRPEISHKMKSFPATATTTIEKAVAIGKQSGLRYVYPGNIPGLDAEHTECPKCANIIIKRRGYRTKRLDKNGRCPNCSEKIPLIF